MLDVKLLVLKNIRRSFEPTFHLLPPLYESLQNLPTHIVNSPKPYNSKTVIERSKSINSTLEYMVAMLSNSVTLRSLWRGITILMGRMTNAQNNAWDFVISCRQILIMMINESATDKQKSRN